MEMMIRKLIYSNLIILLSISLCACAHKSGHNKKDQTSNEQKYRSNNQGDKAEVSVDINHRSTTKMDGSVIFAKYNTAVFMIYTSDGTNAYQGSGFFIDDSGLAVSNYHVFQGTNIGYEQLKLVGSDSAFKVTEVLGKNEEEDIIVFRVNCDNTNYIPIAIRKPNIGEKVYAIGSPRGLENTFSSGEVSQWRAENLMQINALIDHGSSGGALINEYGEAVGITSGSFYDGSQANLNYAWSIDVIKPYVEIKEQ